MKAQQNAKVRFKGDMVVITSDAVIGVLTRAQFVAALKAEQTRRQRALQARGLKGTDDAQ